MVHVEPVDSSSVALSKFGEYQYDHLLLLTPTLDGTCRPHATLTPVDFYGSVQRHGIVDFLLYGSKVPDVPEEPDRYAGILNAPPAAPKSLLLVTSEKVPERSALRDIAEQLGIDVLDNGVVLRDHVTGERTAAITSAATSFGISNGKPIKYAGGGHTLVSSSWNKGLAYTLVSGTTTSFASADEAFTKDAIFGPEAGVVTALQAIHQTRIAVVGDSLLSAKYRVRRRQRLTLLAIGMTARRETKS